MGPVRRREQGVVMFVTVLLLVLMGALGLAALDAASRDRDAAGYYNRENAAFYAAEAGVSHARALGRGGSPLPFYYGDPAVPNPIRSDGDSAGQYSEGMNLQSKGAKAMATLWTINVKGETADGASSRIEAKEVKFIFGGGY